MLLYTGLMTERIRICVDIQGALKKDRNKLSAYTFMLESFDKAATLCYMLSVTAPISSADLSNWRKAFYSEPKNIIAQNGCSRVDPLEMCTSRQKQQGTQHVYNHKVSHTYVSTYTPQLGHLFFFYFQIETEGKPVTNQKSSGRCWLFAALNVIRVPFIKHYNLEEFEFSQSYLFYCDKISRCHHFLSTIVETARRGEEIDGRLMTFLLYDPTCDGGQWDMLTNLIKNFGLMPKKHFPESFSSEASGRLNAILKSKVCKCVPAK